MKYWKTKAGIYRELPDHVPVSEGSVEITKEQYELGIYPSIRSEQIINELESLDLKSIRAIREGDSDRIAEFENKAESLRQELKSLKG